MQRRTDHRKKLNEDMFSPDVPGGRGSRNSYTYGFEYRIVPLDSPTIRKLHNDRKAGRKKDYDDKVFVGMDVTGYCGDTNRMHRGRIVNFEFEPDGITYKHIIVIDRDTNEEVRLLPNAIEIILPPLHPKPHISQEDDETSDDDKFAFLYKKCNEAEVSLFDDDDELSWDDVSDDDLYREIVVEEYSIEPELERYWTEKFRNMELFKVNAFDITVIETPFILAQLWGYEYPDQKVTFGGSIRRMMFYYGTLSGQTYSKRIDLSL